jgi:multiple sugar transport system substrate-binding protein
MKSNLRDLLTSRPITRRAALGGAAAALAAPAILRGPRSASAAVNLDFTVWSYAVDIVQDNIDIFQGKFPNVTVKLSDFAWPTYHETMVNRFSSKTPTDVAYNGGNWLEEFAAAGWVVPLEDHFDWVKGYQEKVLPFAWQDMTFNGKVYGLPYYADTITFMYNEKALQDAGIAAPPQTWEEVLEQCLTLKAGGMESPFVYEFANTLPNVSEAFASMVFGRGGELIDEELNPLWTDPNSPAALQLKWLVDAKNEHGVLAILPHETDIAKAMNTGQHAFTVMFNYNLAALNNAATSPLAGQFKLALMPGETHECYGFAKFYNMTVMAVERGQETIDAVGSFIQYFAGEVDGQYPVAKRWAVEQGLGFGQIPLLDDPDVQTAYSKWLDVALWRQQLEKARGRRQAIWYGLWSEQFHPILGRALAGEISSDDALEESAKAWNDLKERVQG